MVRALNKLSDLIFLVCKVLLICLSVEITVIIGANIFGRYILQSSLYWAEEVTRYSFVWMTFFGAACAYKQRGLVSMSVLTHRIRPDLRWRVGLIIDLVMTVFMLIAFVYGTILTAAVYRQTSASLIIPMTYVYLCLPLSFLFMLVFNLTQIVTVLKSRKPLPIWGEEWS